MGALEPPLSASPREGLAPLAMAKYKLRESMRASFRFESTQLVGEILDLRLLQDSLNKTRLVDPSVSTA